MRMSDGDPLMCVAAAAREIGLNRSTLARQVNAGAIRRHGGKVRLSEVYADGGAKGDSSSWIGRERTGRPPRSGDHPSVKRAQDDAPAVHATTCTGIALTPDLIRDLGLVLESQDTR